MPTGQAIRLTCTKNGSAKEYFMYLDDCGYLACEFGRIGNCKRSKNYGPYKYDFAESLLKDKLKKGYEIISVCGKPFTSGILHHALDLMTRSSTWENLSTAQPFRPAEPEVASPPVVTFDAGQFAPVW